MAAHFLGAYSLTKRSATVVTTACMIALMPVKAGSTDDDGSPLFGVKIPTNYRDWQLTSVAHEAGKLNDIRAVLGNDIALKAYRDGTRPFPDGAIIGRLAWEYVPSQENNEIFGEAQSFVPGTATNIQFSVRSRRSILTRRVGIRPIRRRQGQPE